MNQDINTWQDLEDFVLDFIDIDNPRKPAGSGSAKKEEDVSGQNILAQCKFTEDKNVSILKKDLDRLIDASALQNKYPIFVNKSSDNPTIMSIPISYNLEIAKSIIRLIMVKQRMKKLKDHLGNSLTKQILDSVSSATVKLQRDIKTITNELEQEFFKLDKKLEAEYANLLNCNLFEGEPNG